MKLRLTDGHSDAVEFEAATAAALAGALEQADAPRLQVHVQGDWISPRYPRGNGAYRVDPEADCFSRRLNQERVRDGTHNRATPSDYSV